MRTVMDRIGSNYDFVVMDNEAGMEHLSRRTTQNIDDLLLVSDHSVKGIRAIARVKALVDELKLVVKRQSVLINLVADGLDPAVSSELARLEIEPSTVIPLDKTMRRYDLDMKPLLGLPDDSPAVRAVSDLMEKLLSH